MILDVCKNLFLFPSCLRSRLAFRLKETRFDPPAELRCVPFPGLRAPCITSLKQSCCSEERGPRETRSTSLTPTSRPKHKVVSNPRTFRHHTGSNCVQIAMETGGNAAVHWHSGRTTNSITGRSSQAVSITHFISPRRRRACSRMSAAVVLLETGKRCNNSGGDVPRESPSHGQTALCKTTMDFNHAGRICERRRPR